MRWLEEPWIKWYTRDTPEWLALSVHARGLLPLIASKVDRDGTLKVGKLGLRGIAIALFCDWATIEPFVQELVDDGRLAHDHEGGVVVVTSHAEAQSAIQSEAIRSSRYRERKRFLNEHLPEGSSRAVTDRHARHVPSRTVTDERDGLSRGDAPPSRDATLRIEENRIEKIKTGTTGTADAVRAPREVKPKHRNPETMVPADTDSPADVDAWAAKWKIPTTDREDFNHFLDCHRKKESRWRDWAAAWRNFQRNKPQFSPQSETRLRSAVVPPHTEWKGYAKPDGGAVPGHKAVGLIAGLAIMKEGAR